MMATYNGERYVAEQIDSILSQKGVDVTLLISDDGSVDGTCAICEGYAGCDSRVRFRKNPENKGLARNFMDMVYDPASDGYDYYAFSDQDDVWLPEKLDKAVEALSAVGGKSALYYSDVENVGEDLGGGTREFAAWARCAHDLVALLTVNWASGCTMVFNPKLRSWLLSYKPATYERNHDGWVHLVAMITGTVVADLDHSYIKRRISGGNQVGVRSLEEHDSLPSVARRWKRFLNQSQHSQTRVARYLFEGYGSIIQQDEANVISTFAQMPVSLAARLRISSKLYACEFPTKSMAHGYAAKALMNRL